MKTMKNFVKMTMLTVMAINGTMMLTSCQKTIEETAEGLFNPLNNQLDKWNEEDKKLHLANLQSWTCGETDEDAIRQFGYENCFKVVPVSANFWESPKSVDLSPIVNKEDLCEVRSLSYVQRSSGRSELRIGSLLCDKRIANDLLSIFRTLYEEKYPVEGLTIGGELAKEQLLETNLTFCYYYDSHNSDSADQLQQKGLVVILNPAYPPTNGNDRAVELFRQHGFTWGGDTPDGQCYRFERNL